MDSPRQELFICSCGTPEHQFIVSDFGYDPDCPEIYIAVMLIRDGFWRRLKTGIKYILGQKSKYGFGHFDEVCLELDDARRLRDVIGEFLAKYEEPSPDG